MIDITWFYQGMEDFGKIVLKNMTIKCISISSIFIFIKGPNDIWIYVLIYALSNLIGNLSLWIGLKKHIKKVNKISPKRHLKPMLLLLIPQVAMSIYNVLDKTMLGILVNDISQVGFYEQSQKITRLAITIVTAIGTVMIPRISNVNHKGDKQRLVKYIYGSFNLVWFLSIPIMFGLIVVADNLVPWFFGNGFEEVSLLIKVCSPIAVLIGLANVLGQQYLVSTKKQNKYTYAVVASAVFNFLGNLILIPKYTAIGATISSVVAELVGIVVEIYFIRKELDLKPVFRTSRKYFIAGVVMFAVLSGMSQFLRPTMLSTFLIICLGSVVYLLTLIVLKDKFVINMLNQILSVTLKRVKK